MTNMTPGVDPWSQFSFFICAPHFIYLFFFNLASSLHSLSRAVWEIKQHHNACSWRSPHQLPSLSRDNPAQSVPRDPVPTLTSHVQTANAFVSVTPTPGHSLSSPISCSKITASSTALMSGLSRALDRNSTACNTQWRMGSGGKACFPDQRAGEPPGAHCSAPRPQVPLLVRLQQYELGPLHLCTVPFRHTL